MQNAKIWVRNKIKCVKLLFLKLTWSYIKETGWNYYRAFQLRHSYRTINKILKFWGHNTQPQISLKIVLKKTFSPWSGLQRKNWKDLCYGYISMNFWNIPFNVPMIKKTAPLTLPYLFLQPSNQNIELKELIS